MLLSLDPSGSFTEGKGTTGYCFYDAAEKKIILCDELTAYAYATKEEYWNAHILLIEQLSEQYPEFTIVMEDYLLYANKAEEQINSRLETPKLIGILQHYCWLRRIPVHMQTASEVKSRWNNEILLHKGIIVAKGKGFALPDTDQVISRHCIDAIRHATHHATFKWKGSE